MERTFEVFNAKDCTTTEMTETDAVALFGKGAVLLGRTYQNGVYYGICEVHADMWAPYGGRDGHLINRYCNGGGTFLRIDVKK